MNLPEKKKKSHCNLIFYPISIKLVPKCSINLIFFETNTKQKKRINFKGSNPLFPSKKTEISDFWSFFDPKINSKIGQKTF